MSTIHWVFEHDKMLDPDWTPEPGQTYRDDCPKARCQVTSIRAGVVYFRYLGQPGPAPFSMSMDRWKSMGPVEVKCSDCEDWDILVATDCCDKPRMECRTVMLTDYNGDPDVRVCRDGHGCEAGR